jgi:hypothetical protein
MLVIDKHRSLSLATRKVISALSDYSMVQHCGIQFDHVRLPGANGRNKRLTAGNASLD